MRFHADLHVHSKYSRATSRQCDLEHLSFWARKKGIAVVGTGDFTHPAWLAELKEKLVAAEPGLFRLRPDLERETADRLPLPCHGPTRFMLSVEISTIYKKGDFTRKIHHLIYVPDFETADRVAARLARIGNIASDGRPILGLDSRHLLEIALESGPGSYLVPAHIWTPWFAVLGSRSGFDSVAECYGDLAEHIFAVETGLSSDPAMNWRISFLDRCRLVSNSDAHSPAKLGREATLFDTELEYYAIRRALETGAGYIGTVEFFPEEGKYHLDGHRKCGIRLTPRETETHGGRCPACGQSVTVGVLNRVDFLADRAEEDAGPPATAGDVLSLVPLPEILSEIAGCGPSSRKVERGYERLISSLGPELSILETVPLEEIGRATSSLLAEAIARLRAGKVIREAGYDGEYGAIRLFEEAELRRQTAGGLLFDLAPSSCFETRPLSAPHEDNEINKLRPHPEEGCSPVSKAEAGSMADPCSRMAQVDVTAASGTLAQLDPDQRKAAEVVHGPLMIVAGPGSGKTRTLTHRIAHLVADHGIAAAACLAITFTRRAAFEMRERLAALLPGAAERIPIHTFHSLALSILKEHANAAGLHRGFRAADEAERVAALAEALGASEARARRLLRVISIAKRTGQSDGELAEATAAYERTLALRNWIDFDDLVALALRVLSSEPGVGAQYRDRYRWISVDEFQDVDAQQYALVRLLAPAGANLCVIGDADQAIYAFRGADASCFHRFKEDYPGAAIVQLARNYRSSGTIVRAAAQVITPGTGERALAQVVRDMHERITIRVAPTERAEAEFVVHTIEQVLGGHSFFSIDSGRAPFGDQATISFADIAVLYRTDAQSHVLCEALARSGMPFQKHSHEMLTDRPGVRALMHELAREQDEEGDDRLLRARLKAAAVRLAEKASGAEASSIWSALQSLTALAERYGDDRARFAELLSLASEADCWDPRADRVSLLTLHAAKGLEFSVVFIVGLEDGILPLHWSGGDDGDAEEERRLFYVGMTRAKDRLILSRAVKRRWRGALRTLEPSPYLDEIESELLRVSRAAAWRRREPSRQLALF